MSERLPAVTLEQVVAAFEGFYPTQKIGYFDRCRGGKLGLTMAGALAIVGGMGDFSGTQDRLLCRANRIGCDAHPAWFRYGASDGWRGRPINRQEPEGRHVDLWRHYEAGYALGRAAAFYFELPVPDEPFVCHTRDDYETHYVPAYAAHRAKSYGKKVKTKTPDPA